MKGRARNFTSKLHWLLLMAVLLAPDNLWAQADMLFSQYWAVPTLYNPARTGETDFVRLRGGARLQWLGVTNAPKSFMAVADSPFLIAEKHRVGAGVTFSQETIGLFSNLLASAQGSYKFRLKGAVLSAGIQIGYYNTRFRGSEIYIPDDDDYHQSTDPNLPKQDVSGNAIDAGIGLAWTKGIWHASAAVMHLTSPKINMGIPGSENSEAKQFQTELPRMGYFDAGGNIKVKNTLFSVQPSVMLATDFSSLSAQFSVRATYNNFLTAGLNYRLNDAVGLTVGATFKNFIIGYAYDLPTSALGRASSGSHEFVAGYQLKLDLSRQNKFKHRSIRIM